MTLAVLWVKAWLYLFVWLNRYFIRSTPDNVVMSVWVPASAEPVKVEGGLGTGEVEDLTRVVL